MAFHGLIVFPISRVTVKINDTQSHLSKKKKGYYSVYMWLVYWVCVLVSLVLMELFLKNCCWLLLRMENLEIEWFSLLLEKKIEK
jgi:hypothetical protein